MGGVSDFAEQKHHSAVLIEDVWSRVVWEVDFFTFLRQSNQWNLQSKRLQSRFSR